MYVHMLGDGGVGGAKRGWYMISIELFLKLMSSQWIIESLYAGKLNADLNTQLTRRLTVY